MHLQRFVQASDATPRVGVTTSNSVALLDIDTMGSLLALSLAEIRNLVETAPRSLLTDDIVALPPCDGLMEVWAAGVTYERSKVARVEESAQADVYERVYGAARPELFLKAVPWRTVTDGEDIAIRRDSAVNVPEAELAVVANASGEIVGFTICNDMSSRQFEGENPLYLPQAKIYAGSCALASRVRPSWELDASDLEIGVVVERSGSIVWEDRTSTMSMRRSPEDLIEYLFREEQFPQGVILSTGTGLVPTMDFTIVQGDVVIITIEGVGQLSNTVVAGKQAFSWLVDAEQNVSRRGVRSLH
jgi:2-dehydro-3-deoxy-D-arabinonate dehydratase